MTDVETPDLDGFGLLRASGHRARRLRARPGPIAELRQDRLQEVPSIVAPLVIGAAARGP
ncbi:MAG TPA: hypothetical protein VIW03_05185 [Anaeromyxobacter sp.]